MIPGVTEKRVVRENPRSRFRRMQAFAFTCAATSSRTPCGALNYPSIRGNEQVYGQYKRIDTYFTEPSLHRLASFRAGASDFSRRCATGPAERLQSHIHPVDGNPEAVRANFRGYEALKKWFRNTDHKRWTRQANL